MNTLDHTILTVLNSLANQSPGLDAWLNRFQWDNLLKGALLMAAWWYCWYQHDTPEKKAAVRRGLVAGIAGIVAGLALARTLAHLLPFRPRPFVNPEIDFVVPDTGGTPPDFLSGWSSFPSDHAVVWFAIATSIYLANRRVGLLALAYAAFLGLGRIYSGLHYPTDILAGAAIGAATVWVFNAGLASRYLVSPVVRFSEAAPNQFYALAFLCTYEISTMFDEIRELGVPIATSAFRLLDRGLLALSVTH